MASNSNVIKVDFEYTSTVVAKLVVKQFFPPIPSHVSSSLPTQWISLVQTIESLTKLTFHVLQSQNELIVMLSFSKEFLRPTKQEYGKVKTN